MTALTPDRAVRLLRAKAGELEALVADGNGVGLDWVRADIALIAGLLADHIEAVNERIEAIENHLAPGTAPWVIDLPDLSTYQPQEAPQ